MARPRLEGGVPADRASGDAVAAQFPSIRTAALENRKFLRRAVTYLADEAGIRQYLDIGTGLPTASNTHEVAQAIAPDAWVVRRQRPLQVGLYTRSIRV